MGLILATVMCRPGPQGGKGGEERRGRQKVLKKINSCVTQANTLKVSYKRLVTIHPPLTSRDTPRLNNSDSNMASHAHSQPPPSRPVQPWVSKNEKDLLDAIENWTPADEDISHLQDVMQYNATEGREHDLRHVLVSLHFRRGARERGEEMLMRWYNRS